MARQINQTLATNSKPSWWEFLNSRRKENSPIRVLLMAADKDAVLEIEKVAQQLEAFAQRVNVRLLIDPLDGSHLLTMYEVRKALENSQHHLIHYVGHATFNEDYPESSYLGTPQDEKDGERITAGELHDLLQESPTQFLYLSCCSGAEMGKPTRGNQHWGLLHAAINAGVAASLGFRWWVRMESARRFAEAFYQSLDDSPLSLEHAAFRARKAIHRGVIHVVSDDALKQ
jgi:CHAT domain-containing protein